MTPNIQTTRKAIVITPPLKTKKRSNYKFSSIDKENVDKIYEPMEQEIEAGVNIITRFIQKSLIPNKQSLEDFQANLLECLRTEYTGHWYPETPDKGSAFRCLRVNQKGGESLIEKTAKSSGLTWVLDCLPKEFTIWIDPGEVSYRIGEEGSICVHFSTIQHLRRTVATN